MHCSKAHGYEHQVCELCGFSSVLAEVLAQHVRSQHPPTTAASTSTSHEDPADSEHEGVAAAALVTSEKRSQTAMETHSKVRIVSAIAF